MMGWDWNCITIEKKYISWMELDGMIFTTIRKIGCGRCYIHFTAQL